MSATGLEVFDTTVQKTNVWLKDLMEVMGRRSAQGLSGPARQWTAAAFACLAHLATLQIRVRDACGFVNGTRLIMPKELFRRYRKQAETDFPFLSRLTISPSISAGLERLALSTRRTTSDQN